jgi:hypothetical protein
MFVSKKNHGPHENKKGTKSPARRWDEEEFKMADSTQKDPKDWISGSDPVTGAQEWYLEP